MLHRWQTRCEGDISQLSSWWAISAQFARLPVLIALLPSLQSCGGGGPLYGVGGSVS